MRFTISQLEATVVFAILASIATYSGGHFSDWSASIAVFLGFLHAQLAFEIAEKRSAGPQECGQGATLKNIFVAKEGVWIITFAALGSYPLLAGALIFISYPSARRYLRSIEPRRVDFSELRAAWIKPEVG